MFHRNRSSVTTCKYLMLCMLWVLITGCVARPSQPEDANDVIIGGTAGVTKETKQANANELTFATAISGSESFRNEGTFQAAETVEDGSVYAFAFSERPDDARFGELSVKDGVVRVVGRIGMRRHSSWAGIALQLNGLQNANLAAYRNIKLQLSSKTATILRLRIMGDDQAIINAGCYPIFMQPVTEDMQEYVVPLNKFMPEGYCGTKARHLDTIIRSVAKVEVSDVTIDMVNGHDVDFQVGTVSFSK